MLDNPLNARVLRAPAFAPGQWLNTSQPLSLNALRGKVLLVDFWEYSCINCIRTLPYLREWHHRYAPQGLVIVGVHSPEFRFGRERQQIEAAIEEFDIPYPVLMDDQLKNWDAYATRFWPTKYLIDQRGYIRYEHHGEGSYGVTEQAIQALLREERPDLDLPPIMQPLREEDRPGAVCYRPTGELSAGLLFGALGNPQGYARGAPMLYAMPDAREAGAFYLAGAWQAHEEYFMFQGQIEGLIRVPYEAVEVNAVLTPHGEVVERMLHPQTVSVEVWQDEMPLDESHRGRDLTEDGRVLIDRPRMYNLVRNPGFEPHELVLRVKTQGVGFYSFSFTGCVKPD